jgi:hypothetical protein
MRVAVLPKMRVMELPRCPSHSRQIQLAIRNSDTVGARFRKYALRTPETDSDSHRKALSEPERTETTRIF